MCTEGVVPGHEAYRRRVVDGGLLTLLLSSADCHLLTSNICALLPLPVIYSVYKVCAVTHVKLMSFVLDGSVFFI